jgi:hypothetical protein
MVQCQIDRWPHSEGKKKFTASKMNMNRMRSFLLNPTFRFTKQTSTPMLALSVMPETDPELHEDNSKQHQHADNGSAGASGCAQGQSWLSPPLALSMPSDVCP